MTQTTVTLAVDEQFGRGIRRIAEENNVPVVENRPVARELYTNVEVGDIIPDIYFTVLAEIYSHLEKFKNMRK